MRLASGGGCARPAGSRARRRERRCGCSSSINRNERRPAFDRDARPALSRPRRYVAQDPKFFLREVEPHVRAALGAGEDFLLQPDRIAADVAQRTDQWVSKPFAAAQRSSAAEFRATRLGVVEDALELARTDDVEASSEPLPPTNDWRTNASYATCDRPVATSSSAARAGR